MGPISQAARMAHLQRAERIVAPFWFDAGKKESEAGRPAAARTSTSGPCVHLSPKDLGIDGQSASGHPSGRPTRVFTSQAIY